MKKTKSVKSRIFLVLLSMLIFILFSLVLEMTVEVPSIFDQYVLLLLPLAAVTLIMKVDIKERFKFNKFKWSSLGYIVLLVFLVMPVSMFISQLTDMVFGANPSGIENYVDSLDFGFAMLLFHLAITPAICEELLFRGLLMDNKVGLNMHKLALLNGLLFGLFHIGYDQIFYCVWMGMVLGYVTLITNSIYPAIIIHFLNNAISVVETWIYKTSESDVVYSVIPDSNAGLFIMAMVAIIAFVAVVFVIKRLIVIYNYDDRARIAQNSEDKAVYCATNKFKVYWPLIVMSIYVVLMNVLLANVGSALNL